MAVRINFNPNAVLPQFFIDQGVVSEGKLGELFIQFSSIYAMEQAVVHSKIMNYLPDDVTVTDLKVSVPSKVVGRIADVPLGTFVYETQWGEARLVIVGYSVSLEATDPRSFLATHRALLNGLITEDHRQLECSYPG